MKPLKYLCRRGTPHHFDGSLNDLAWQHAQWTPDFVDIEGDLKPSPRFRTRAKMLWDENFFYVGAWLNEPQVWATLTEHDSVIFHDNDFEVFIDPDGDAARYFEFEVNAFGTTWDLYLEKAYRDGGSADNSWETYAKVAVKVDGKINDPTVVCAGWGVEIAFPWDCFAEHGGMASPPRAGDVWRVNFSRVEWHVDVIDGKYIKRPNLKEDNWVWSPQGMIDMHQPEMWGYVEFSD